MHVRKILESMHLIFLWSVSDPPSFPYQSILIPDQQTHICKNLQWMLYPLPARPYLPLFLRVHYILADTLLYTNNGKYILAEHYDRCWQQKVRPFSVDEILPEILPATYHMFYSVSEHDLHLFNKSIQSTHIYHENDNKKSDGLSHTFP